MGLEATTDRHVAGSTLFWRLFGAFLLAHVLALAAFTFLVRPVMAQLDADRPKPSDYRAQAVALVQTLESEGPRAAARALRRSNLRQRMVAALYNAEGQSVLRGRPPAIAELRARAPELFDAQDAQDARRSLPRGATALALTVDGASGQVYRWVAVVPRSEDRQALQRGIALRVALAILGLAFVSWLLSRWLARPLEQLGVAVRALGDGDLAVRVGPSLASRGDEVGTLGRDFNAMAEQTQALVEARNRLVRDVSHELRSPLARLRVALELARDGSPKALDRIDLETERLDRLIEHLLTMTRLEGRASLRDERTDLVALCRSVIDDVQFEHPGRVIRLIGESPLWADVQPDLMASALENVLRNALHYSAQSATSGATSDQQVAPAVEITAQAIQNRAQLVIRDFGPGVPQGELEAIFQPFYRTSHARERQDASQGHGVGLAIVAQVVRTHRGTVRAGLPEGGGLRVEISLPLSQR